MIGVSPRADADLATKTDILRASSDELALKVEEQNKEILRLRKALEQLKTDHSDHITRTISRMSEIDTELTDIATERHNTDKKTAEALKQIERIRRDLVHLGAKLAKEFILLPPAVSRYPRLDKQAAELGTAPGGIGRATGASWYTDEQPAANLQMVDLCLASAIAALDGKITDEDFKAELDAARNDPDSLFSKESLIRSVAASSPMKRRRASLLMLSQASDELAKQSATMDSLTRHPTQRWSESERLLAIKAAQTQDLMIRDAVKELCKVAPVPRQAERQLLTSLNMHTLSTAPPQARKARFVDDEDSAASPESAAASGATTTARSVSPSRGRPQSPSSHHQQQLSARQQHQLKFGRLSIPVDVLGDAAAEHAAASRGSGRDATLRRLQAELQDEQSAMSLRSHAARVKAWQELDLKRAARERLDQNDVANAATSNITINTPASVHTQSPRPLAPTAATVLSMVMNSANVLSAGTTQEDVGGADESSFSHFSRRSPSSPNKDNNSVLGKHTTSYFGSAEKRKEAAREAMTPVTPTRPILTFVSATEEEEQQKQQQPRRQFALSGEALPVSPSNIAVHRSTGLLVRPGKHLVLSSLPPAAHIADFNAHSDVLQQALEQLEINREKQRIAEEQRKLREEEEMREATTIRPFVPPRPPPVQAGVADPENATQAVTMRRTGKMEAQLSFHNERLEAAARRAGAARPNSGSTRFHWKLRQQQKPAEIAVASSASDVD